MKIQTQIKCNSSNQNIDFCKPHLCDGPKVKWKLHSGRRGIEYKLRLRLFRETKLNRFGDYKPIRNF